MTLAKMCGLTTPETLDAALDGGAAFVGAVVFPKSPRHIDPLHAATISNAAQCPAPSSACTRHAVAGSCTSGVTVATMIASRSAVRSTITGATP